MADLNDPKARVKQLNIVYWAMGLTQVFIGAAVYLMVTMGFLGKPDYSMAITLQKIALVLVPVLMGAGYFLFRYMVGQLDEKLGIAEKLKRYFSLVILRTAFFEGAFFVCCVFALITSVQIFLWIAPVPFLLFLLQRPNPGDIKNDLKLGENDYMKVFES